MYLFEKCMFIRYNKYINKRYPIYLMIVTNVALVDEKISHSTF